jgi:hypothetical protein
MLFAIGSAPVRAACHGLLINIVHSLYTSLVTPENKLQSLQYVEYFHLRIDLLTNFISPSFYLADFGQLSFRLLFGIGGSNVSAFSAPDPTSPVKLEKVTILRYN